LFELLTPATVGLSLAVVGVIFLANSMGIRNPRRFISEHFGVEQHQPLRAVHQQLKLKAQIFTGFLFLLLGFSVGIVAEVLGPSAGPRELVPTGAAVRTLLLLALCVVALSMLLRLAQNAWSLRVFRRLLHEFFREHADWNFEKHPGTTREIGEILGVARQEEDSIGDYAVRVRAALRLTDEGGAVLSGGGDDGFAPLRRLGAERRP
jgi:hypothetical protein